MKYLLLAIALVVLGGCGEGQRVLSAQATVHVAHQQERFRFYQELDERCGEEFDVREEYRECMAPARHIARSADSYRAGLLAAQAALDASDEDGFQAMLPDLIEAARRLAEALVAANVPVPQAVLDVLSLGGE